MNRIIVCAMILLVSLFVAGCGSMTIEEAFRKQYPDKEHEILYMQEIEDKQFALYKSPFKDGNTGIGLAVFEGSHDQGWKLRSSTSYYSPSKFISEADGIELKNGRSYIYYGFIDTPDITKIEVTDKYDNVIEGKIINTNWKRLWYAIAEVNEMRLKAFSIDGEIVVEVPFKK